jgi:hypothetical protein
VEHNFWPHSSLDLPSEEDVWKTSDMVDLDIMHSPVVPYPYQVRSNIPIPVIAKRLEGGDYLIVYNRGKPAETAERVPAEMLKIMRCRYIMYRNGLHRIFPTLAYNEKCVAAGLYFDGVVPFASGRHHDLIWGRK